MTATNIWPSLVSRLGFKKLCEYLIVLFKIVEKRFASLATSLAIYDNGTIDLIDFGAAHSASYGGLKFSLRGVECSLEKRLIHIITTKINLLDFGTDKSAFDLPPNEWALVISRSSQTLELG